MNFIKIFIATGAVSVLILLSGCFGGGAKYQHDAISAVDAVSAVYEDYDNNDELAEATPPDGYSAVNKIYIKSAKADTPESKGSLFAEVFQNDSDQKIYIFAFRGTKNFQDLTSDIKFALVSFSPFAKPNYNLNDKYLSPGVHTGFFNVYKQVQKDLMEYLHTLSPSKVIVTGHSMGAAVGSLFLYDVLLELPNYQVTGYFFGSPRVGSKNFADGMYKLLQSNPKYSIQIINNVNDLVPAFPVPLIGYQSLYNIKYLSFDSKEKLSNKDAIGYWHSIENYKNAIYSLYYDEMQSETMSLITRIPPK